MKGTFGAGFVALLMAAVGMNAQTKDAGEKLIETFNKRHLTVAPEDGYGGRFGTMGREMESI